MAFLEKTAKDENKWREPAPLREQGAGSLYILRNASNRTSSSCSMHRGGIAIRISCILAMFVCNYPFGLPTY